MPDQNSLAEMLASKVPTWAMPVPEGFLGWVDNFVRWMSRNVLIGGFAIIAIILLNYFSAEAGFPAKEDTFAILLSMLVLGISILVVHVDFDIIAQQYHERKTWYIRLVSFLLAPTGIVLAIIMAPSVNIEGEFISTLPLANVAYVVFFACVAIAYFSYMIKLCSRGKSMKDFLKEVDNDYSEQVEKQTTAMKFEASQTNEVDGVRV